MYISSLENSLNLIISLGRRLAVVLKQFEAHLITIEIDVWRDAKRALDPEIFFQGDNNATDTLTIFGQVFLHIAHKTLNLTHNGITGASSFQFDDQVMGFVLGDGENVDGAGICRVLLAN